MSGNKAGAKTIKQKYGKDFFQVIGKSGGKKGTGHKFAHGKVDPRVAGSKSPKSKA